MLILWVFVVVSVAEKPPFAFYHVFQDGSLQYYFAERCYVYFEVDPSNSLSSYKYTYENGKLFERNYVKDDCTSSTPNQDGDYIKEIPTDGTDTYYSISESMKDNYFAFVQFTLKENCSDSDAHVENYYYSDLCYTYTTESKNISYRSYRIETKTGESLIKREKYDGSECIDTNLKGIDSLYCGKCTYMKTTEEYFYVETHCPDSALITFILATILILTIL